MYKKIFIMFLIILSIFNLNAYAANGVLYQNSNMPICAGETLRFDLPYISQINFISVTFSYRYGELECEFYNSKNQLVSNFLLKQTVSYNVENVKYVLLTNSSNKDFTIDYIRFLGVGFEPVEPLKFSDLLFDKFNNVIKYVFNKDISVNKEDILLSDEFGNQQDFNFTVNENILSIFPFVNFQGRYKIQPTKVFSVDGEESVTDIPSYSFEVDGIQLIQKNFGNYISADLQNLILTFDRDIKSSKIVLRNNTDNSIMKNSLIINGSKLIIDYEAFKEDTSYTLTIETLNAVDGNELKNPLVFNFKTVKSTGNGGIDTITADILNVFTEAQNNGIKIVVLAIGIGIIFILARWLWNKTKLWLKKS